MGRVQRATSKAGKQYLTSPLSEFVFDTGGWDEIGWANNGGIISKLSATIGVFIPDDVTIKSATLNVNVASRKITNGSYIGEADGYYAPQTIKLYNGLEGDGVYFDYPVGSEAAVVTTGGALNTSFGTWNISGSAYVQTKSIDLTSDLIQGKRYEIKLTGGNDTYSTNSEYLDGGIAKLELIVLCVVE